MLMSKEGSRGSGRCVARRSPSWTKRVRSASARSTVGCRTTAIRMRMSAPLTLHVDPPPGVSTDAAGAAITEVLDSVGDTAPNAHPSSKHSKPAT